MPVRETLRWVLSEIGTGPRRMLEIGAGEGELAAELVARGHDVLALDASEEAVRATRARGVHADRSRWPAYEESEPFDVVLFGRSLHHIGDLEGAARRASEVLLPSGRVLVEDFAFHEVSPDTIHWFRRRLEGMESRGVAGLSDSDGFAARLLGAADPVEAWFREADHIHPAEVMREVLDGFFVLEDEREVPYLYRYVDAVASAEEVHVLFRQEVVAIATGSISALGRRFVGRTRGS